MELYEIQTPAIIIDLKKVQQNMQRFQTYVNNNNCTLRPHIKTHKIPRLAKMQIEYGAVGITCAKLGEAEIMADNGIKDIFVAYPIIGETKVERFLDLSERIRMICGVDSLVGAKALSDAAVQRGMIAEVRLEIDTGAHRTGVFPAQAVELGKRINALPGINLSGIFTFKSMVYQEKPTLDPVAAGKEEGAILVDTARQLREAGVNIVDVSAGSTPTAQYVSAIEGITEVRPGTYVFQDAKCILQQASRTEDVGAVMKVTVVSTPAKDRAVIDAGTKTLAGDTHLHEAPMYLDSYGRIIGYENLRIARMNEEHGVILCDGETNLKVGQTLYVVPDHICPCINLFDEVFIKEIDGTYTKTSVLARGKSV